MHRSNFQDKSNKQERTIGEIRRWLESLMENEATEDLPYIIVENNVILSFGAYPVKEMQKILKRNFQLLIVLAESKSVNLYIDIGAFTEEVGPELLRQITGVNF